MAVDDDLAVGTLPEPEAQAPVEQRRRGFWLVAGSLGLACVFVLIEIFANFGTKDTIAHAEATLRRAQAAAESVRGRDGSLAGADATRLGTVDPGLHWVDGSQLSTNLDEVSVAVDGSDWGAAVQARPGACFYIHLRGTSDDVLYGVGTVCTGEAALSASDSRW
jgi:hypothetical protein